MRCRAAFPLSTRIGETNRLFAYFTGNTFRFRSTTPAVPSDWDAGSYIDCICAGIYRHLLGADKTQVTLAGRGHVRPRGDFAWVRAQPEGGFALRTAAYIFAKILRRASDRVTVDVDSFREALSRRLPGSASRRQA